MKTLEEMCNILNRLLDVDDDSAQRLFGLAVDCSPTSYSRLLADKDITVNIEDRGMTITPLSLVNSLVCEQREDGEYAIYRDIDEVDGTTQCFFVAKVSRS